MQLLLMFCSCSSCVTVSMAASRSRCMQSICRMWDSCASAIHFRRSWYSFPTCVQMFFIFSNDTFASLSS
uniref:Putative secreted peptide n=1 Tax=Anopheles braziliensis TaxID=58242 RepID=A0A2M3ZT75_9DIPT